MQGMPSPQRQVTRVQCPPRDPLAHRDAFLPLEYPNCENIRKYFLREGKLRKDDALQIIAMATRSFETEPNLLRLAAPVTVAGNINGQFFDLTRLFEVGGFPGPTSYLFLGDYINHSSFSIEVVLYLFALKASAPEAISMLRGHHECLDQAESLTFKRLAKYDIDIYNACMKAFSCLPLAAVIGGKYFCVHGGLSPSIDTLEDINKIDRFRETPTDGPMCDLIWSDPTEDRRIPEFAPNSARKMAYVFGQTATRNFLDTNNLWTIIRSHEVETDGYKVVHASPRDNPYPGLITICSCPQYRDRCQNKGAVAVVAQDLLVNIRQFDAAPHPYWLPGFQDALSWSLPFVASQVADFARAILASCDDVDDDSDIADDIRPYVDAVVPKVTEQISSSEAARRASIASQAGGETRRAQ